VDKNLKITSPANFEFGRKRGFSLRRSTNDDDYRDFNRYIFLPMKMWKNTFNRRELLQWAKSSRTRAGVLMVVATVVTFTASTASSSSTSPTTTASTTSTRSINQGGFLPSLNSFWKRTSNDIGTTTSKQKRVPVIPKQYDRLAHERNTVSALGMAGQNLKWFRLDDGVMGGQSTSDIATSAVGHDGGVLHFTGTINTNGGGFTSIRAELPSGILTPQTTGIKICFRGDGKTYKLLLSDGSRGGGGGARQTPSWQVNLPTNKKSTSTDKDHDEWQELVIPFSSFIPNVGVGPNRQIGNLDQYTLDPVEMKQIGFMLSLLLADGQPNPKTTFGSGIFEFSLHVQSIEPVMEYTEENDV
jgi:Complex I intermediate-associated protein 30 (CIA30)